MQIGGKPLKVVSRMELLGIVFDFFDPQSDDRNAKFQKAIQKLQIRADRGAKLPLPKTERAKVIATAAVTALTYGQSVLPRYGDAIKKARNRITRSLGFTHTSRCEEIVDTLIFQGHRLDPEQAVDYAGLSALKRLLQRNQRLRDRARAIWNVRAKHGERRPGKI